MTYIDEDDLLAAFAPLEQKRARLHNEAIEFDRQIEVRRERQHRWEIALEKERGAANRAPILGPHLDIPFAPAARRNRSIFDGDEPRR